MIEKIPASKSSAPYFDPKTQRFHDAQTKRMITNKAAGAYKSAMDPSAIQPMQGPTEPNEQTGMLLGVLSGMKSSLEELVSLTKESLGFDKKDENRDVKDQRAENLKAGDTDPKPKPSEGGMGDGFLKSLKDTFGNIKEKFRFGDKMKLLLLASGLFLLSKYSVQVVEFLEPVLKYFKEILLPKIKAFGNWFLKYEEDTVEYIEDEFGNIKVSTTKGESMELDMDKIKKAFAIGIASYLTLKFLPSILWKVGGLALKIPGIGAALGIIGLGAYLIWSAIQRVGESVINSADWTQEKGATDDPLANTVGSYFGGEMKGGFKNALTNAGYWGKTFGLLGLGIGLFGGPLGVVAGGVLGFAIGAVFGGILGLIGGGLIAKTFKIIQDSIIDMVNWTKDAMLEQEEAAKKRDLSKEVSDSGGTDSEAFTEAGFDTSHPRFMKQFDDVFANMGFGIYESAREKRKLFEIYKDTANSMEQAAPNAFELKNVSVAEYLSDDRTVDDALFNIDRELKTENTKKDMFLKNYDASDENLAEQLADKLTRIGNLESARKVLLRMQQGEAKGQIQQSMRGDDFLNQPAGFPTDGRITESGPAMDARLKLISELDTMVKASDRQPPITQYNKGGDITSQTSNAAIAFNKVSRHDEITMDQLATSRG